MVLCCSLLKLYLCSYQNNSNDRNDICKISELYNLLSKLMYLVGTLARGSRGSADSPGRHCCHYLWVPNYEGRTTVLFYYLGLARLYYWSFFIPRYGVCNSYGFNAYGVLRTTWVNHPSWTTLAHAKSFLFYQRKS